MQYPSFDCNSSAPAQRRIAAKIAKPFKLKRVAESVCAVCDVQPAGRMPKAGLQEKLQELCNRVESGLLFYQGDVKNIGITGVTGSGYVEVELDPIGGRCWVSV